VVREFNCAIHEVAFRYRQACAQELEFLRAVIPEAEIEREEYMMSGGSVCTYRIMERA
jgi:predicted ArsR family transcriptional regulator